MRATALREFPGNLARSAGRRGLSRRGLSLAVLLVTAGCASVERADPDQPARSAGPLTWEVSDIGRVVSSDNQRIRWSYVITLRNGSDRTIQLERFERAISVDSSEAVGGSPISHPFRRTLEAQSELRVGMVDTWGWMPRANTAFGGAAMLRPIVAMRSFRGKDELGTPVEILARVRLDPSVGRLARPVTRPASLAAPRALGSDRDLAGLAGVWRGSYRLDGALLDVPFEVTIGADGTCQVAENDPVTNRFRRSVRVKDGGLEYAGDRERGILTLHETQGRRALAGRVNQIDGPSYTIYLEAQSAASTTSGPGPHASVG